MTDLARVEALLAPLLEAPTAPLPPGKDIREDPAYAVVATEIAKLSQLSATGVEWGRVRSAGEQVLRERAKDLMTVAGVSLSYVAERGTGGLAEGALLLADTLDRHWELVLPEPSRLRGRANAIAWFVERAGPRVTDASGTATVTSLAEARAAMTRLGDVIVKRFPSSAPSLTALRDVLDKITPIASDTDPGLETIPVPPARPSIAPARSAVGPIPRAPVAPGVAPPRTPPRPSMAPPPPARTAARASVAPAPAPSPAPAAPADPWAQAREQVDRYLKPIPGDRRGGVQARFHPRYESVRTEAQKLESMTGDKPDWGRVVRDAGALLEETSKDILIASYLAFALGEEQGLAGYVRGVALLAAMVDEYWPDAFPDLGRARARKTAVEWFIERAQPALGALVPKLAEREAAEALVVAVEKLGAVTRERFEVDGPSPRGRRAAAPRVLASVRVPAPVAPPPPPPEAPRAAAAPAAGSPAASPAPGSPAAAAPVSVALGTAPSAQLGDVAELVPYLQTIGTSLISTARLLRTARPTDPAAFRLMRVGAYLHIAAVPPSNGGKLGGPPPEKAFRDRLELMRGNGKWTSLLDEAEGVIPQQRLFLDLHEHVDAALEGLGADYAPARTALRSEMATVARRLQGLAKLTYNDGTPLASARTQAFLEALAAGGGNGGGASSAAPTSGVPAELVARARGLVTSQKLGEALVLLNGEPAASPRIRFELRTLGAELALEGGRADVARTMFDGLGEEADAHGLDHWDPALAARVWAGLAKTAKGDSAPMVERRAHALRRLARIDPTTVLVLMSP